MILYENLGFCACAQDVEIFKKRGSYDMIPHGKEIKVFTGSSNPDLADMICKNLGISLGKSTVTAFACLGVTGMSRPVCQRMRSVSARAFSSALCKTSA